MKRLQEEFGRVEAHNYELEFVYPTEETRKHLRVVNRDRSASEQKKIQGASSSLSKLVSDIGEGKVLLEDLPPDDLAALRRLLDR